MAYGIEIYDGVGTKTFELGARYMRPLNVTFGSSSAHLVTGGSNYTYTIPTAYAASKLAFWTESTTNSGVIGMGGYYAYRSGGYIYFVSYGYPNDTYCHVAVYN